MVSKPSVGEKINVICRVRPFLEDEDGPDDTVVIQNDQITLNNFRNPNNPLHYKFPSCHAPDATQQDIYENDVLPIIDRVFEGYDATIFAYGVTGSGKTYTMEGTAKDPGIIPRVARFLFETKAASSNVRITMSYMEIFKECVYDLLLPKQNRRIALDIREGLNRDVFVADLTERPIKSYNEFQKLFRMARKNRSTASTKLNARSSRSHAILSFRTIVETHVDPLDGENDDMQVTCGKINLIDLAGSEDNRRSGNEKARMTESAAINRSLFVLGQVVEALNVGSPRIPFRDSKMTRILQPTLGGKALGMMIINIAPGQAFYADTLNALKFASRSREIRSRPKRNIRKTKTVTIPSTSPSLSATSSRDSFHSFSTISSRDLQRPLKRQHSANGESRVEYDAMPKKPRLSIAGGEESRNNAVWSEATANKSCYDTEKKILEAVLAECNNVNSLHELRTKLEQRMQRL
ncbi:P-loop containing nucleoside triphosphate hydrolase protein [Radiomyces spectabilis]|uniref:P-loop containing nucleoside triphosphate hydrolase protein n=1 Tax=Radiomyces spectabilis TaxID=64574 RepID=UPI00221F7D02|nr:P-loop containing nucleoside triphosphate hydrolase protein [Radiomyces spectabilis]KAI8377769.1 P-loop containing nucleoside triphosphate hydrolase protein [Radiomyces spectabilis]